jgi:hypothetical protein
MNESKKQLIAQINKIAEELYIEKERVLISKQKISDNKLSYILGGLVILAIPLVFFLGSKKNLKGIANSVLNIGKFALATYCKKQVIDLLEKK